jgi:hypothetical protein
MRGIRGETFVESMNRHAPLGGVRSFHQKSTCLTQPTFGANVVHIWSRYAQNIELLLFGRNVGFVFVRGFRVSLRFRGFVFRYGFGFRYGTLELHRVDGATENM